MPGANSQYFLFKLTCDAARLMNAPKKFRVCTTVIAQLLSAGVKGPWGTWGGAIVHHMVEKPQSCLWAFCVATWFGKDDRAELVTGIQPLFEEGMQLEEGARFDLPQRRSPWSYTREPFDPKTHSRPAGTFHGGRKTLCHFPGTKEFKNVLPRAWLVLHILMYPRLYVAIDGATHFALTDVRPMTAFPDAYTSETKEETEMFFHIVPILANETLSDVAERMLPGSTNICSRDQWFWTAALIGNQHSQNQKVNVITRMPPRKEPPGGPMKKNLSATSDGRTILELEPYVDPLIQKCKYKSAEFVPAVNCSEAGLNPKVFRVKKLGLVRMPVHPALFERPLPGALWDEAKWGRFTKRLGLCIMHGGMRTAESNVVGCTLLLRSIFVGNGLTRTYVKLPY